MTPSAEYIPVGILLSETHDKEHSKIARELGCLGKLVATKFDSDRCSATNGKYDQMEARPVHCFRYSTGRQSKSTAQREHSLKLSIVGLRFETHF
jgi:hypothetical protein